MYKQLKQRFSLAVSFGDITPEEYIGVLEEYKYYIHDIYFSPTENLKFQTRKRIYDFNETSDEERKSMLQKVITYAHNNDIECCMTLNTPLVSTHEQVDTFERYQSYMQIDHLTTTLNVAKIIRQRSINIPLICSYNEAITNKEHLMNIVKEGIFEAIVLGGQFLRDLHTFEFLKKNGLKTILMLNTGCCVNCTSYCKNLNKNYCINLFNKNKKKYGIEYMYAQQSIFPEEIQEHFLLSNSVNIFKLASRPIKVNELNNLLSTYVSLDSKSYIEKSKQNYHLYGRLALFSPYYDTLDYNSISNIKKDIWATNTN